MERDFRGKIARINKDMLPNLPRFPNEIGGEINIMIGKQYLKYFPKKIVRLESGFTL